MAISIRDKKIIFFDADGTLWYPKNTKHTEHPSWIWKEKGHDINGVIKGLMLVPNVKKILEKLVKNKINLVVLSTSPFPSAIAKKRVIRIVNHFKIKKFFKEIHGTETITESKGKYILKIIKKYKFSKREALMVGDSYEWDYESANKVGVDAILIDSKYLDKTKFGDNINIIKKLEDIIKGGY